MAKTTHRSPGLSSSAVGMLVGLGLQYLLGMATNLFVSFPTSSTPETLFGFAWSHVLSAAHILLGFGLLIGGIATVVRVHRSRLRHGPAAAWLGLIGILLAGLTGSEFVITQGDSYSFAMATAFLVASAGYIWLLTLTSRQEAA